MAGKTQFKLEGAKALEKIFETFPFAVVKRTRRVGLRRSGARMRTYMRNDAPRRSGNLRRALRSRQLKSGAVTVGLKDRFYYKTLDLHTARGAPLAPWFENSVERHAPVISQMIVNETKMAINVEAGKAYSRSKSSLRRK